ncbi:hypothetical protein BG011_010109 [Mortierella polycephala]|uniref:Transcriptional regulatory protein RXT2 N-terminal domain-containing protein n=1 Tax=Mortierella polycephala TaxID=41804 RepID=A0A9P6QAQ3_9FUNG|nr:hypothetical protein BG011_010109 [Mortierella polycephala]
MLDQSVTMDAEHLMALKHGKRSAPFPEGPIMSTPTIMARKVREESSDEEEIGFVPHNRGNKLKRRANPITGGCRLYIPDMITDSNSMDANEQGIRTSFRRSLIASTPSAFGSSPIITNITTTTTAETAAVTGSSGTKSSSLNKREVIQVRRVGGLGDEAGEELSDDENPYADIKMGELLSPLETSTEILQRPQLRKLFHSPQLQIMAVHAMAMIEREKLVNKMMSRMALILQGDDPLYPQLGYGMGEGCSTASMGMPDQEEFIKRNKEWRENGEDRAQVQKTLSLLMENINCSNQYIDLLSESRNAVNHVSKEKRRLWKKLKEKRERELRRRLLSKSGGAKGVHTHAGQGSTQQHHRDKHV